MLFRLRAGRPGFLVSVHALGDRARLAESSRSRTATLDRGRVKTPKNNRPANAFPTEAPAFSPCTFSLDCKSPRSNALFPFSKDPLAFSHSHLDPEGTRADVRAGHAADSGVGKAMRKNESGVGILSAMPRADARGRSSEPMLEVMLP
jgi:hypothetical protein